jgi:hypothetical protein
MNKKRVTLKQREVLYTLGYPLVFVNKLSVQDASTIISDFFRSHSIQYIYQNRDNRYAFSFPESPDPD